ncbi:MAG: PilT/PilU family type 4a pilus ATPase [Planctomycetes bacterium]|nr:PilT/PilU family type 4a pilus ATPase [Planctomycetota bacterium]
MGVAAEVGREPQEAPGCKQLGELALRYGLVEEAELARCLEVQATQDPPRLLGDLLVDEGLLSRASLDRLLATQRRGEGEGGHFSRKAVAERAEVADLDELLRIQVEVGATDLHLTPGARIHARIAGRLVSLAPRPLEPDRCRALIESALTAAQVAELERERSLLVHFPREGIGRFRLGLFVQSRGLSAAIRRIPEAVPEQDWLALPPILRQVPRLKRGLVLVTGPRGSGKTTTLASVIELFNQTRRSHVVTLERPIEYVLPSRTCLISQREVGTHVASYAEGLRSVVRENPDVIVLAELATPDQIMAALTAAETGHLVLGTLHTSGAHRSVLRVLDAYSGRKRTMVRGMLASVLRLVVSQHLLPGADGLRQHLATEVLVATPAVARMIREDRVHQLPGVMQTSGRDGMSMLDDALVALVRSGRVAVADALPLALDPARILRAGEEA